MSDQTVASATSPAVAGRHRGHTVSNMKVLIVAMLVLIVLSLVGAGFFVVRDRGRTRNSAWALTVRVSISVALFLLILLANQLGWIRPHGLLVQ